MEGSFILRIALPHGAVEISETKNGNEIKVNVQHLKSFLESVSELEIAMGLFDPMYR